MDTMSCKFGCNETLMESKFFTHKIMKFREKVFQKLRLILAKSCRDSDIRDVRNINFISIQFFGSVFEKRLGIGSV